MKSKFSVALGAAFLMIPAMAFAAELRIGDPAPALEVQKWVKGTPVDLAAAKDKQIIVMEFWATWCAPCIESIPHLTDMQKKYGPQGVAVIGMTSEDGENTLAKVEEFVAKQGAKMGYAIAFDKDHKTEAAYMEASGQQGIPTAFVIDKSGRVAWIGSPFGPLDDVVEQLVAGKYDIDKARRINDIERRINSTDDANVVLAAADEWIAIKSDDFDPYAMKFLIYLRDKNEPAKALEVAKTALTACAANPKALVSAAQVFSMDPTNQEATALALQAVDSALKLDPTNADAYSTKFGLLAMLKRYDEAMAFAESAIKSIKSDGRALASFAAMLASPELGNRCDDLAIQAIELAIKAEPEEPRHLVAKFDLLATCKKDMKAAEETGRYLLEKSGMDAEMLNAFAWKLLTSPPYQGKFNALALAVAERGNEISGGKDWSIIDTLALAKYENGQAAEAVALEKKAIELCPPGHPAMEELKIALRRFEAAVEDAKKPETAAPAAAPAP
jgi:peroxiredoxin